MFFFITRSLSGRSLEGGVATVLHSTAHYSDLAKSSLSAVDLLQAGVKVHQAAGIKSRIDLGGVLCRDGLLVVECPASYIRAECPWRALSRDVDPRTPCSPGLSGPRRPLISFSS